MSENIGQQLTIIANRDSLKPVSKTLSRAKVAEVFDDAFEMIGGVSRLAWWANENPGEFFKLYSKLMPGPASPLTDEKTTGALVQMFKGDENL